MPLRAHGLVAGFSARRGTRQGDAGPEPPAQRRPMTSGGNVKIGEKKCKHCLCW